MGSTMHKINAFAAAFALLMSVFTFEANAKNSCIKKDLYDRLMSGNWTSYTLVRMGKRYSGTTRWLKNGRAVSKVSQGKKVFKGSWRKSGKNVVCTRYSARNPSHVCYDIKNSC